MAHTFFCEFCGKRFDVPEALIGKLARCKDCKHEFVIPGAKSEPPAPDPYGWTAPLSRPVPPHQSPYALQEQEVHPPRLGKPHAPANRRRRCGDGFAWIMPLTLFAVAVGLMLLLSIAIFLQLRPLVAFKLVSAGGLMCLFMMFSGYVLSLIIPFCDDATEGLLCLFVPFYKLYYWWNHRESMTPPLLLSLAGVTLLALGLGLLFVSPSKLAAHNLDPPPAVASNSEYERLVEQKVATYRAMKDVLAKVDRSEEAQGVAERYRTLANRFSGLEKQTKELIQVPWKISADQINRLHGEDYRRAQVDYLREVIRVSQIEEATAILKLDGYAWQNRFLGRRPVAKPEEVVAVARDNAENPLLPRMPVATVVPADPENALARPERGPVDEAPASGSGFLLPRPAPGRDLVQNGVQRRDLTADADATQTPAPPRLGRFSRKPGVLKPRKPPSGSAAMIAERLGTPQRAEAVAALKAMGPAAEAAVIPHLRSDNWGARNDACQILKVIGTEKSVAELRVIAGNHGPSAQDAREALLLIASRSGAVDPQAGEPRRARPGDP